MEERFDVYEYEPTGHLFSKGVSREFGENRVIFVEGHQILSSVSPLHDSNGLKKIGYVVNRD